MVQQQGKRERRICDVIMRDLSPWYLLPPAYMQTNTTSARYGNIFPQRYSLRADFSYEEDFS